MWNMRFKIILVGVLVVFILLSYVPVRADCYMEYIPYWWKGRNFTGEISKVEGNWIVVKDCFNNKEKKFEVNVKTKLFLHSCMTLREGLFVKIVYKKTRQKNIAKAIREIKKPSK